MRLSRRLPVLESTAFAQRLEAAAAIDLTETNLTRCGVGTSLAVLAEALVQPASLRYAPDPLGDRGARTQLARWLTPPCEPEHLVLTASTSEAYGALFKVLCDPGDTVAIPVPGYPLLRHLAELEHLHVATYGLHCHDGWWVDLAEVAARLRAGARAVIAVNPNNPTGSVLSAQQADELLAMCAAAGVPLICDEVFWGYDYGASLTAVLSRVRLERGDVLVILRGLSKLGFPQLKLAWMQLAGAPAACAQLREALGWVLDATLSVGMPVQVGLGRLLQEATRIQEELRGLLIERRRDLMQRFSGRTALLPADAGFYAVLKLADGIDEEALALELAERFAVLVHPGYFYDFASSGHLVLSLVAPRFEEGIARLMQGLANP